SDHEHEPFSQEWLEAKALEKGILDVGGTNWEFDRRFCGNTGKRVEDLLSEEQVKRDANADARYTDYANTGTAYDENRILAFRMEQQAFLSENVGVAYVNDAEVN